MQLEKGVLKIVHLCVCVRVCVINIYGYLVK